jgi:hypothetical protein
MLLNFAVGSSEPFTFWFSGEAVRFCINLTTGEERVRVPEPSQNNLIDSSEEMG